MSDDDASQRGSRPSDPPSDAADRIAQLEFHLAHQQRICEQLNEVATDQARRLDRLDRALLRLEKQLKDLREQPPPQPFDPRDDRPPHY